MWPVRSEALRSGLRRLGTFGFATMLSALSVAVTMPIVIRSLGLEGWSAVVLGQSLGGVAAVLISFSWGVAGSVMVARTDSRGRWCLYRKSILVRAAIALAVTPCLVAICFLLPSDGTTATVLGALAIASAGLGGSWFLVGEGNAVGYLFWDSLPRVGANVLGALVASVTHSPVAYAAALAGGGLAAVVTSGMSIGVRYRRDVDANVGQTAKNAQLPAFGTAVAATTYQSLPMPLTSALVPELSTQYALADRFLRLGQTALTPVNQFLLSWIPASREGLDGRLAAAQKWLAFLGVILLAVIGSLVPSLADMVAGGTSSLGVTSGLLIGVIIATSMQSQALGIAGLQTLDLTHWLFASALTGAIVLPAAMLLLVSYGTPGVLGSIALAELAVLCIQGWAMHRHRNDVRRGWLA